MIEPKFSRPRFNIMAGNYSLYLGETTRIMGIINITPDSFSRDGVMGDAKNFTAIAVRRARRLAQEGADMIDLGGESSRPGSKRISVAEEKRRILPAIAALAKTLTIPISVDTYKSSVAQAALDSGAGIINNIKGVRSEKTLLKMVARYKAAIVLMHIQGTPRTMQQNLTRQRDLIPKIIHALRNSIENCLEIGVKSDKIIIDPGIGFGKTAEQNLEILARLQEFQSLKYPILIGTSRKSFIGQILNQDVQDRLYGTLATVAAGIMNGAHIVRVHDVAASRQVARVTDCLCNQRII